MLIDSCSIAHKKPQQLESQTKRLSFHRVVVFSLFSSARRSTTTAPWNAPPHRWATAGPGGDTEVREGATNTTPRGRYRRRGGLPGTDTGGKTEAIERRRGRSAATTTQTQVGRESTSVFPIRRRRIICCATVLIRSLSPEILCFENTPDLKSQSVWKLITRCLINPFLTNKENSLI